jgi:hypothetical protein
MTNILRTKIALIDKKFNGIDVKIELKYAEFAVNLVQVSAIYQSYDDTPDGSLNEDQAVLVFNGDTYTVETPYEEVYPQWLAIHAGEDIAEDLSDSIDIGRAVNTLAAELEESRNRRVSDEDPASLYYGWQSNIAVAFVQAYKEFRRINLPKHLQEMPEAEEIGIRKIANDGAKAFLDQMINSTVLKTEKL